MEPAGKPGRIRVSLEAFFLWFCGLVPRKLAAHALFLLRHRPELTDSWGYHIRAIHYYEPLPDFRELSAAQIGRRREPVGIDFNIPDQLLRLDQFHSRFGAELRALVSEDGGIYYRNPYFSGLDAALYYAIVRDLKPARIFEVGAGYSTRIAARAVAANAREGRGGVITVIEPYPDARLTEASIEMNLIQERVEKLNPATFDVLDRGDILFIDSSHVLRCRGDVAAELLEILPRLKPGVWVHIHDIFFPFDYPADWLIGQRIAFNEQYAVEAFLTFNDRFAVRFSNFWLAADHPEAAARMDPGNGTGAKPASLWLARAG
jgi:hypothetical protein